MNLFLRIFKIILLGWAFILGLVVSFVIGGMLTSCFDIPEQPDYRNVLDEITCDMSIQQLQNLLKESFDCSIEMNPKDVDYSREIWVAPDRDKHVCHSCLIARSDGHWWCHKYKFYFGSNEKLLEIGAGLSSSVPDFSFLPLPWEWEPKFALSHVQSTATNNEAAVTVGN